MKTKQTDRKKGWGAVVAAAMMLGIAQSVGGTMNPEPENRSIDATEWMVVNDGVMGGVSQSRATLTDQKTLQFSGTISFENNGGFASIRCDAAPLAIGRGEGIRLRVKGDGKKYQLRVRTSSDFDGIAYKAEFRTLNGEWQEFQFHWTQFTATYRGRAVPNAPALAGPAIEQVGFLIADKQEGPFSLEIESIEAF